MGTFADRGYKTELIRLLIDTYGVAQETAAADVNAFIESLRAKDLLTR